MYVVAYFVGLLLGYSWGANSRSVWMMLLTAAMGFGLAWLIGKALDL